MDDGDGDDDGGEDDHDDDSGGDDDHDDDDGSDDDDRNEVKLIPSPECTNPIF